MKNHTFSLAIPAAALLMMLLQVTSLSAQGGRQPDMPVVEDDQEPSGEVIDEGNESNPGLERESTVTVANIKEILMAGKVGAALRAQTDVSYQTDGVAAQARRKIQALTGERIEKIGSEGDSTVGYTANYEFRYSEALADFYLRHRSKRFSDVRRGSEVADAAILEKARRDLETLAIDLGSGMELSVDTLRRVKSGSDAESEVAAYKVFVDLRVDGHPVGGSRLVLSYFLDGTRHKVSARWPAVDGSPGPFKNSDRDRLPGQVMRALKGHPLSAIPGPLNAEAELRVVDGRLRRVIVLRGLLDDPESSGRMGELEVLLDSRK